MDIINNQDLLQTQNNQEEIEEENFSPSFH